MLEHRSVMMVMMVTMMSMMVVVMPERSIVVILRLKDQDTLSMKPLRARRVIAPKCMLL